MEGAWWSDIALRYKDKYNMVHMYIVYGNIHGSQIWYLVLQSYAGPSFVCWQRVLQYCMVVHVMVRLSSQNAAALNMEGWGKGESAKLNNFIL